MKMIIDIPDVYYEALSKAEEIISSQRSGKTLMSVIYSAVGNGTPLDDVKAEIEKLSNANPSYWHSGDMVEREEVLEILDNIGKADMRGEI